MFVTSRCTVEVGSPVACCSSPSVIDGLASENASRISVIFPRTSSGLCLLDPGSTSTDIAAILRGCPQETNALHATGAVVHHEARVNLASRQAVSFWSPDTAAAL